MQSINERVADMRKRPAFRVKSQSSGYAGGKKYVVVGDGDRVTVRPHLTADGAQAEANELIIGALVLDYDDDPRPYDVRRAEAEAAWNA